MTFAEGDRVTTWAISAAFDHASGSEWFDLAVTRLSDGDYLALLGAVHAIAEVSSREEFGPVSLREVTGLVDSDITSLNEVDPAAQRLVFLNLPDTFTYPPGADAVFARLAHAHPLIANFAQTGDGSAMKISDLLSADEWHASEIFREFYQMVGVEHQMSITLPAPLPIVVGIALNRSGRDFDERDRALLNLLRPHLAQAWRRAREYERLDGLLNAASGVLGAGQTGVIVLSDPIHELTPGAMVSLYRFFGRPGVRDPLPARVRHWLAAENSADDLELARPLRATVAGQHLVLRHLPGGHRRPPVLLLDEHVAVADTARGVGLTERESTVLALLGSGATNAEIAAQLSLSPWTVKRHLANIYSKLGVSGRGRAVAMATEIAAHHGQISSDLSLRD